MYLTDYQFVFIPKFKILSHPDYYFTVDNLLYNSKTNRIIKKRVKGGYSKGYTIDGKFITLKNLKPLIRKVEKMSINIFDLGYVKNDFLTNL